MFQKLLSALGLAPKTLDQARGTYDQAKSFAESVSALFTAAGLEVEKLLSAGPDSLKAHIASVDNSAEVTRLGAELKTAQAESKRLADELAAANAKIKAHAEIFTAVGLSVTAETTPEAAQKSFADHVAKQTTLALAKTGHPPAHVPAADATIANTTATDAALYAEYSKMEAGPLRLDFFSKHEAALKRARDAK